MNPHLSLLEVSLDPTRLDRSAIHQFLSVDSYWAKGITRDRVDRAIAGSLCVGAYAGAAQVGFARVVTDRATFAYLADVFVLPQARGQGVAHRMVRRLQEHPELHGLRRWLLATRDAHALYADLGWKPLQAPERWMEIFTPYPVPPAS
jgi:GNAT superfamily N-acetyltransferase